MDFIIQLQALSSNVDQAHLHPNLPPPPPPQPPHPLGGPGNIADELPLSGEELTLHQQQPGRRRRVFGYWASDGSQYPYSKRGKRGCDELDTLPFLDTLVLSAMSASGVWIYRELRRLRYVALATVKEIIESFKWSRAMIDEIAEDFRFSVCERSGISAALFNVMRNFNAEL